MGHKEVVLFEAKEIRRYYDVDSEIWYFSLVDMVEALSESKNPKDYIKKMRKKGCGVKLLPRDKLSPGRDANEW